MRARATIGLPSGWLSPSDHPAQSPRLIAAVACLALALLAVAPIPFQRRTRQRRAEITEVHEPGKNTIRHTDWRGTGAGV